MALTAVATVSPDGVASTSVAEQAGSAGAGRALGAHDTAQNLAAVSTVPVAALLADGGPGHWAAFALGATAAPAAVAVVPERSAEAPPPPARPAVVAFR